MEKLDTRGRLCPIPLFHTIRKLEDIPPGGILEVTADDETAREIIPRWCRMHVHSILSFEDTGDYFILITIPAALLRLGVPSQRLT